MSNMSYTKTVGNNIVVQSNKIHVYPSAYRGADFDLYARIDTEYNKTHLPSLGEEDFYSVDDPGNGTDVSLELCIHGYFFRLSLTATD